MLTSCQQETDNELAGLPEGAIRLTTETLSGNSKASVSNISVKWENGDKVTLNNNPYTVTVDDGNAYVEATESAPIYGYHGISKSGGSGTLPTLNFLDSYESRYSNGRQVIALPMVAYSSEATNVLKFKHASAAIKVLIKNTTGHDVILDRVEVSSTTHKLCGEVSVDLTKDDLDLTPQEGTSNPVTVRFTDRPVIATGGSDIKEVQVPILPIPSGNLTIAVYAHCSSSEQVNIAGIPTVYYQYTYNFRHTGSTPALERNKLLTARVELKDTTPVTKTDPGLFSVADNQKVHFSKGNLQYDKNTATWSFMTPQYSTQESNDENVGDNYANRSIVSLFGWGTSGYNHGATCYQPYSTTNTSSKYYAYGYASYHLNQAGQNGKADWGYNKISNGGNTENSGWRTLTSSQWQYLMNSRSSTKTLFLPKGDNSTKASYTKATVVGVNGIIVFPDNYEHPLGVTVTGTPNYNSDSAPDTSFVVEAAADWAKMEGNGAVFLPAAGYRDGKDVLLVGSELFVLSTSSFVFSRWISCSSSLNRTVSSVNCS